MRLLSLIGVSEEDVKKHPLYKGNGCSQCQGTGYKGRLGIFELVEMNNELRELSFSKAPTSEIKKAAVASGMRTLRDDGKVKMFKGITTAEEIARVTQTETVLFDIEK